jgi:hypothetical protein
MEFRGRNDEGDTDENPEKKNGQLETFTILFNIMMKK